MDACLDLHDFIDANNKSGQYLGNAYMGSIGDVTSHEPLGAS